MSEEAKSVRGWNVSWDEYIALMSKVLTEACYQIIQSTGKKEDYSVAYKAADRMGRVSTQKFNMKDMSKCFIPRSVLVGIFNKVYHKDWVNEHPIAEDRKKNHHKVRFDNTLTELLQCMSPVSCWEAIGEKVPAFVRDNYWTVAVYKDGGNRLAGLDVERLIGSLRTKECSVEVYNEIIHGWLLFFFKHLFEYKKLTASISSLGSANAKIRYGAYTYKRLVDQLVTANTARDSHKSSCNSKDKKIKSLEAKLKASDKEKKKLAATIKSIKAGKYVQTERVVDTDAIDKLNAEHEALVSELQQKIDSLNREMVAKVKAQPMQEDMAVLDAFITKSIDKLKPFSGGKLVGVGLRIKPGTKLSPDVDYVAGMQELRDVVPKFVGKVTCNLLKDATASDTPVLKLTSTAQKLLSVTELSLIDD